MNTIYRIVTLVVVALATAQVAALAWFAGGASAWLEDGNTLTHGILWADNPVFPEVAGLGWNWFIGSVLVPIVSLVVLAVAIAMRNEVAILTALALTGLAILQAAILNTVVDGLAAFALHGALVVVIATIAALAPKGATWASAHRAQVKAVYAHTPLAA